MTNNELRDRLFRDLFDLSGEVALVTGGLGRLGRAYVRTLAHAGAKVAALDIAGGPDPFRTLAADGCEVRAERVDLTDRAGVEAAVARIAADWGAPTILVNNAGMGSSPAAAGAENGRFEDYPEVAWDTMIDSHLKSALLVSQAFVRHFRPSREALRPASRSREALRPASRSREALRPASPGLPTGSIINVSSTYGLVSPDQAIYEYKRGGGVEFFKPVGYSVAKSGVLNFTRWLAEYGAPLGIRANTLVPGGVREDAHAPEFVAEYERRTPLGRMATEDDYNGAVLFLASRASSYMTGATLVVDGGWTAR